MIHPTAVIQENAQIDQSVTVWSNAVIGADVVIFPNCVIGANVYIGKGSFIGRGVHIQTGVFLPNNSKIGNGVFIGPNATFTDDRHPRAGNKHYRPEPPVLEDGCSVGAGAVILPGVRIGKCAMVGAGAVVTRDVESYETVVGCPAEPIKLKEAI